MALLPRVCHGEQERGNGSRPRAAGSRCVSDMKREVFATVAREVKYTVSRLVGWIRAGRLFYL